MAKSKAPAKKRITLEDAERVHNAIRPTILVRMPYELLARIEKIRAGAINVYDWRLSRNGVIVSLLGEAVKRFELGEAVKRFEEAGAVQREKVRK